MHRIATFLALALLLPAATATALESTSTRETYFASDPAAPALANDYLGAHPGDAIQIVSVAIPGKDVSQTFLALGPVARSRQGVCRFTSTQIFPHRSPEEKVSWDSTPPTPRDYVQPPASMAAVAAAPCPRQNDPVYVFVENTITDAEFADVTKFWNEVSVSEEKFDNAGVYLPLILSPRLRESFAAFKAATLRPGGPPMRLSAVFRNGLAAFDLGFTATASEPTNYFLSVSKSDAGFHMLNFQTQY